MNKKKPHAMIQIDCDREWDDIRVSIEILREFSRIFENNNIKATWFVVGSDLEDPSYQDVFMSLIKAGHEIGNHTYSHYKDFISFNSDDKKEEMEKCDKIIKNTGYVPVGFRTPYFGVDDLIPLILKEMEYQYDSSICPSPFLNMIAKVKEFLNTGFTRKQLSNSDRKVNATKHELSNKIEIREIPVSVLPHLKAPAHASYAMVLPFKLSYWYSKLLLNHSMRSGDPLVYVFHLNDLCPKEHFKSKEFKYLMSLEKRRGLINWICSQISSSFNVILTREYADD